MSGQRYSGTQPPEHGEPRTDPWGWLYREDGEPEPVPKQPPEQAPTELYAAGPPTPDQPPPDPSPSQPPQVDQPTQQPATSAYGYGPPGEIPEYRLAPTDDTPLRDPAPYHPEPGHGDPIVPRRGRALMIGLIVGALALVLVIAVLLVSQSLAQNASPTPSAPPATQPPAGGSSQSPSSQSASGEGGAYTGPVSPITATGVTADCVAPDATDGNGDRVSYAAANAVDGNLDSAWRCDGDGGDETLRVVLPKESEVARLGLLNGYAKVDPATGDRRYPEYRRITTVRWELSNGTTFEQTLADETESSQAVSIPVQRDVEWVQVTILTSTEPGSKAETRDAVLISEITVFDPA